MCDTMENVDGMRGECVSKIFAGREVETERCELPDVFCYVFGGGIACRR